MRYTCTNCGHEFLFGVFRRHKNCPRCGATLDQESVDDAYATTNFAWSFWLGLLFVGPFIAIGISLPLSLGVGADLWVASDADESIPAFELLWVTIPFSVFGLHIFGIRNKHPVLFFLVLVIFVAMLFGALLASGLLTLARQLRSEFSPNKTVVILVFALSALVSVPLCVVIIRRWMHRKR